MGTIPCVLGEERRIKMLWCVFWVFFGVWKREKTSREAMQKANFRKNVCPLVWGVPRAIYSPDMLYKVVALERPSASKGLKMGGSWHPWKDLDFLFLKMYGSWKSNDQIKSYGSRKFVVHRLVHHLGFHNISAVLTPILTHE